MRNERQLLLAELARLRTRVEEIQHRLAELDADEDAEEAARIRRRALRVVRGGVAAAAGVLAGLTWLARGARQHPYAVGTTTATAAAVSLAAFAAFVPTHQNPPQYQAEPPVPTYGAPSPSTAPQSGRQTADFSPPPTPAQPAPLALPANPVTPSAVDAAFYSSPSASGPSHGGRAVSPPPDSTRTAPTPAPAPAPPPQSSPPAPVISAPSPEPSPAPVPLSPPPSPVPVSPPPCPGLNAVVVTVPLCTPLL